MQSALYSTCVFKFILFPCSFCGNSVVWLQASISVQECPLVVKWVNSPHALTLELHMKSIFYPCFKEIKNDNGEMRSSLSLAVQHGLPVVRPGHQSPLGRAEGQVLVVTSGEQDVFPCWFGLHAWSRHRWGNMSKQYETVNHTWWWWSYKMLYVALVLLLHC